jgi:pimeloyl-ACP methyl ester carboxylesterase
MQTASVNGVELEYTANGSGEPVLLIGTGPIADSFVPLLSEKVLTQRYRLITYRQRRPGESGNGSAPVSFAEHAADAAGLLGHLGARRAHVAGHSTGAAIALELAVEHPDLVHTLTLLEPPLGNVPSAAAFFEKAAPALAAYQSGDREGAMAKFLSVVCSLDWQACQTVIETHIPGGVTQVLANADNFFGSYLPALNAWQLGQELAASISQPMLSVLGADSDPWFIDSGQLLRSWFPRIEHCRIEGAAHLLHLQRPEPVVRKMAEFLSRHPLRLNSDQRERSVHALPDR